MNHDLPVRSQLVRAGRAIKLSAVAGGTLWWLAVSLSVWLILFVLDNLLDLPSAVRFPLAVAGAVLLAVSFLDRVAKPACRKNSAERAAVTLEQSHRVSDNLLINACQLENQALDAGEAMFARKTIVNSAGVLSAIPSTALWKPRSLVKWGGAAAAFFAVWIGYYAAFPRQTLNALARYVMPLGDIPPAGSVVISVTPAADVVIGEGSDLPVTVVVRRQAPGLGRLQAAPVIVWAEGTRSLAPARAAGDTAVMLEDSTSGRYKYAFRALQRSFCFRVLAADTYSRNILVEVRPRPKIKSSVFRIKPPAYTGLKVREAAGPPSSVSCLPASGLDVQLEFDQPISSAVWNFAGAPAAFQRDGRAWRVRAAITNAGRYDVEVAVAGAIRPLSVAAGQVELETDRSPEIDFVTDNRNFFVAPGTELPLALRAADDFGISRIRVTCRPTAEAAGTNPLFKVKEWTYLGPPGNPGPIKERFSLLTDPRVFTPGEAYLLEAECWDFKPDAKPGRSRPLVLRVKTLLDLALPSGDALAAAMNLLKKTIAEQKKANDLTNDLRTHLREAIKSSHLSAHRDSMRKQQEEARSVGKQTVKELMNHPADGRLIADRLSMLVEYEMGLALKQIAGVNAGTEEVLSPWLGKTADRQEYILNELIALLGAVCNERKEKRAADSVAKTEAVSPAAREQSAATVADDLDDFVRAQKQIVKRSQALQDKRPEDLTKDKEDIVGALAREEAEWAKFLEEKLTDFSKLPLQDFADGSIAKEVNEIIQDIDRAAESLYRQNVEIAVPLEQAGLEKAEQLENNLEKWLSSTPDHQKWSMEEPAAPADIPMAELPAELEDIVGELLDSEEEMQQDVEDVSSSWLDSLDKGAGWDASDGPISSMSAKGVTGNLLPNQQEIGGRSGEGRSGKSHGQMVEESAEGKGGRETPTRLTPSPFEPGSIKDSMRSDTGGATGGGKLSGFSEQGLRGPTAPPPPEKMARLAGQQARIRQEAEALALKLRKYNLPSGDVEDSIGSMKSLENSAGRQDGLGVRRSYNRVVDDLADARKTIRAETGLHRERSRLPESAWREIMTGLQDGTPRGYEELVADYFRRMAGETK